MVPYIMTETESLLAEIIWEREPLGSGELVKLASQRLGWKKATTYTVLRKLCKNAIFWNKGAVVTSKISKEEYTASRQKEGQHISSPNTAPAFFKRRKRSGNDIKERVTLVKECQNEAVPDEEGSKDETEGQQEKTD